MHLSTPIHHLKRQARLQSRAQNLPLHAALDQAAAAEGYQSWSHLSASSPNSSQAETLWSQLGASDLVLLGARPGQGKTVLGIQLALKAALLGQRAFFFTLDYNAQDVDERLAQQDAVAISTNLIVDTSDDISADYIIKRLVNETRPALIMIDYLQLLDQKRTNPSLQDQVSDLRAYVKTTGSICVAISQIDRSFDLSGKDMPDQRDVRLPNPLDLTLFDRLCFLHEGRIRVGKPA